MKQALEKTYQFQKNILFQEVAIWENKYREKKCSGKSEKQLRKEGWYKLMNTNWYSDTMAKSRDRYFRKKMEKLGLLGLSVRAKDQLLFIPGNVNLGVNIHVL